MLKYNGLEFGWECSVCGAIYGAGELARVFDYTSDDIDDQKALAEKNMFTPCHCMDCGTLWEKIVIEK